MQTNSTTNATISALRSLLSGNANALNSSVSAQPSFQILAVHLTAARPQTNANAQEQQTLTNELSALANRDGRFSHSTDLIRAALQSYSLANNPATSNAARTALQNRAQRALAQAQRELDAIEMADHAAQSPTPAGQPTTPTRQPTPLHLRPLPPIPGAQITTPAGQPTVQTGQPVPTLPVPLPTQPVTPQAQPTGQPATPAGQPTTPTRQPIPLHLRPLPALPVAPQGQPTTAQQQGGAAAPTAAVAPPLPAPLVVDPTSGLYEIPAAVMQQLSQRLVNIAVPPSAPAAPQQNATIQIIADMVQAAQAGQPVPIPILNNPALLLGSLSYLVSHDLAPLHIDMLNPAALLFSLVNSVVGSPSGINHGLEPLKMVALLLKALRELAATPQGQAPLQGLVAQLDAVVRQPIPGLTLLGDPPAGMQLATTRSVSLEELLLAALRTPADPAAGAIYNDFADLTHYMNQSFDPADAEYQSSRNYLSYYLANNNDTLLNGAIGTASASVLTRLRYVMECFVRGFHAIEPIQAEALFPGFAAAQRSPPLPTRPAPTRPTSIRPQHRPPLSPRDRQPQPVAPPIQSSTGIDPRYFPVSRWRNDWPEANTNLIRPTMQTLNFALGFTVQDTMFRAITPEAKASLARGMAQILDTAIDPIGMIDYPTELKDLFCIDQNATFGDPFVVPEGSIRVLQQLNSLLLATQQLANVNNNQEVLGEIHEILSTRITSQSIVQARARARGDLLFSEVLQDDGRTGAFSRYISNIFNNPTQTTEQKRRNMHAAVSNVILAVARARVVIRALIENILNGAAINLPARTTWRPDDDPSAGAAASAVSGRRSSLSFMQPSAPSQSRSAFREFFRRRPAPRRDKSVSTPDLTTISPAAGASLPDLRGEPELSKKTGGFFDRFKPKKTAPPSIEIIHTSLGGGGGSAQANAPINQVVTSGFVPWNYPQNIGDPVTSHKEDVLKDFNLAEPAQAATLQSADATEQKIAVIHLLNHQREKIPTPADEQSEYNPLTHRFRNILPMKNTLISTSAGASIGVNNMVVEGKVVGMACSLPLDSKLGEMYNFMFEHVVQGVHVIMQDSDFQKDEHTNYFDPQRTSSDPQTIYTRPSSSFLFDGFRINAVTHKMEFHDMGISTSSGRLKVEKVSELVYDRGLESETKCFVLKLSRRGVERQVKVLHSPNWVDQSNIPVKVLNRLLELREICFDTFSPDRILTHCRAGVGRTGTLLAAEAMRHLPGSNLTDIVLSLRDSRNFQMVQTSGQLKLLMELAERYQYPIFDQSSLDPANP